jgi:hypothetical protein
VTHITGVCSVNASDVIEGSIGMRQPTSSVALKLTVWLTSGLGRLQAPTRAQAAGSPSPPTVMPVTASFLLVGRN